MRMREIKDQPTKVEQLKKFAEWAMDQLKIQSPPSINYGNDLGHVMKSRSFGSTSSNGEIWVHVGNRNVADCCRTLAHELIHHSQFEEGTASVDMDEEQRQFIEDEANAIAGRMMRTYGKEHEEIYESSNKLDSIIAEALSSHGLKGRSLI